MSDLPTTLDEALNRLTALAAMGPQEAWEVEPPEYGQNVVVAGHAPLFHCGDCGHEAATASPAAASIVSARTAVPALINALRSVLTVPPRDEDQWEPLVSTNSLEAAQQRDAALAGLLVAQRRAAATALGVNL